MIIKKPIEYDLVKNMVLLRKHNTTTKSLRYLIEIGKQPK